MSLAVLADHMASKGRGPDSMLIHMSPREVQGLQALAENHGGSLTINPETGLPEAGFLDKLLPTIIGAGISYFSGGTIDPKTAAMIVGGVQTARTGDIGKGIQAGLGAYGGATLTAGMAGTGADAMTTAGMGNYAETLAARGLEAGKPAYGEAASQLALESQKEALATPFADRLSTGYEAVKKAGPMQYLKANAMPLAGAFGPAIFAGMSAEENMPKTTTGMIRPYTFDPYSGTYTSGNPYQATPTRGAEGGLMGMNDGGYSPGQLDFTQKSEPVVRMAGGGKVERFAIGRLVEGGPLTGGAGLDMNNEIYKYFSDPATQALLASGNDKAIAQVLQDRNYSLADVAKATGTQDKLADYERRFTQAVNTPTTDATEFLAATTDVGLQNQGLATALQNSGLSAAGQYASTHNLNDAAGITTAPKTAQDFYTNMGYTAGALPGDKGGLEGLYANINYSAKGLQDQINAGKLTVAEAQTLARGEMGRVGVNEKDIKSATGVDFASLFKPKPVVQDTVTGGGGNDTVTGDVVCGPGYKKSIDGKTCVPDTTVVTQETQCPTGFHYDPALKQCVKNLDATQTTTTNVTTPTSISTADRTALPVGVSGAGVTTINPNSTVSTRPNIPGIPEGGFTGMTSLRKAYEEGGGSLGVNKALFAPTTTKEIEDRYKLTGGSKQSYDYLTGKTKYSPVPYTETGEIMKPYGESVLGIPANLSKKMYIFKNGKYEINPDYAIPTYDKEGKKSYNLTNADVTAYMDKKPSTSDFYTWATTNNLTPEQIAQASGRSINEISKLFTGAKDLVGEDGKIDQTKLDEKTAADEKTNFDADAYLKANQDVMDELTAGKANFGTKDDLAAAAWEHYQRYGKAGGRKYTKKAKEGGLMALADGGITGNGQLNLNIPLNLGGSGGAGAGGYNAMGSGFSGYQGQSGQNSVQQSGIPEFRNQMQGIESQIQKLPSVMAYGNYTNSLGSRQPTTDEMAQIEQLRKGITGDKDFLGLQSQMQSMGNKYQQQAMGNQSSGLQQRYMQQAPSARTFANGGLMAMARGGMAQQFNLGDYSDGGRLLRGPGDGVSDSIPASIGGKRPARLADGEFVVPARIVSELGNGSTEAGARKLYAMMDRIQKARRGTVGRGRVAKNSRSEKYLPA